MQLFATIAIILLAVAEYSRILHFEWTNNEQYAYGMFVPFVTLFFLYRRFLTAPVVEFHPQRWEVARFLQFACVAAILPFNLIFYANPDWRLLFWLYGFGVVIFGLALCFEHGGWKWVRHFAPAWCLLLLAIPWPSNFEIALMNSLMDAITGMVMEVLPMFGVLAVRVGHVIHLKGGFLGVEEACSGIRSLQLSLVAAYAFGELEWLTKFRRLLLVVAGIIIAFLTNVFRILALTLTFEFKGKSTFESQHDEYGNLALVLVVVLIWSLAVQLRKKAYHTTTRAFKNIEKLISPKNAVIFVSLWFTANNLASAYYAYREEPLPDSNWLSLDLSRLHPSEEFLEIPKQTKNLLRFSSASAIELKSANRRSIQAYRIFWNGRRISSFAGIHRPEICLPAVGYSLVDVLPNERFFSFSGESIPFKSYEFDAFGNPVFVFFSIRDNRSNAMLASTGNFSERMFQMVEAKRISEREMIEIIVYDARSEREAWSKAIAFCQNHVNVVWLGKP